MKPSFLMKKTYEQSISLWSHVVHFHFQIYATFSNSVEDSASFMKLSLSLAKNKYPLYTHDTQTTYLILKINILSHFLFNYTQLT